MSKLRKQIIEYINRHPMASTRYVAGIFGVSQSTVRSARNSVEQSAQKINVAEFETPQVVETSERANDRQVAGTHYKDMGVQPWDVVDTWPREQRIGYYRGGALKYLMRMGSKDESPTEIAKGQHYIQKLLEVLNEHTN
jgi:methylmalonyl-CoA mutase N-terminal domain/subunit